MNSEVASQLKSHSLPFLVRVLILAVIYFAVAKLGLLLSFVLSHNTLVWPPTGVALAALLVFGVHLWPGITLGAFLVSASTGVPLIVACGVSVGNTLEALLAVFLLHRIAQFDNALERIQDVFALLGLAAGLSTMISATIDVASLCWGGVAPWEAYGLLWRVWWLGGAMSNSVVAPLILAWSAQPRVSGNLWRVAELGALLLSLFLVCHLLFGGWSRSSLIHAPLSYAVFPFIIWAALRFGQREAATVTFVISAFALWGTAQDFGPFVRGTLPERLLFLYTFMSVAATTALVLAAIVNARKRAEAEKQKLQEQLFQARKLEALGTLAGGVAHDFNDILSAIMGFTELAADDVASETDAHHNLHEVLKASRRAKALVQQILTFSQPLSQQKPSPIHLSPIIEEVLTFLRASLPQTIELRQYLDEAAGPVTIIPSQLRQVLSNLCHNAVQALGEKGGVLDVSLRRIEVGSDLSRLHGNLRSGPHLQLTVRDTGCGMPSEIQGRIFEPFFTTRPVGEGNGLGLAVVHGIVTGHGGAITVDSVVGRGTTFQVYLPVDDVSPLTAEPPHSAVSLT